MQQPRAASGRGPSHPDPSSRTSSLPRPTINTSMTSSDHQHFDSPSASTPDALHFYGRRQTDVNQTSSSPPNNSSPITTRSFDQNATRSFSGPTLTTQRSSPIITSSERMRKSSFKDLVARFNQNSDNDSPPSVPGRPPNPTVPNAVSVPGLPRSPNDPSRQQPKLYSTSSTQPWTSYPSQRPSDDEHSKTPTYLNSDPKSTDSSRPRTAGDSSSTPHDQPPPLFGEVIPHTHYDQGNIGYGIPPPRGRSGSEGSMHYPNAMFPQSRDSYFQEPAIINEPATITNTSKSNHAIPTLPSSPTHGRSQSDVVTTRNRVSKIPVKASRHDDLPDYKSYLILEPPYSQSLLSPQTQAGAAAKSSSSGTTSGNNRRLNAIITAPTPRESPPLRSSRPRQDINAARGWSPSQRSAEGRSPDKPKSAAVLNTMDIATRRESIRRALRDKGWPTDQLALPHLNTKTLPNDRTQTADVSGQPLPQLSSATYARPTQPLKVNVPNTQQGPPDEPTSGTTHFEEDDSPVVEGSRLSDNLSSGTVGSQQGKSAVNTNTSAQTPTSPGITLGERGQPPRTVWSQVVDLRRRDTSRSTQLPNSSSPLEQDDAGTIQIMLSDTPVLNSPADGAWHSRSLPQSSETDQESSPNNGTAGQATPNTSEHSSSQFTPTSGINMTYESINFRRDRDPYSWISRILDQYRESGIVSPDMVHDFQQHILDTDPDISTNDDIDSMTLAKAALEDIIKDHAHSLPSVTPAGGATFAPSENDGDDPFWQVIGSNMTVVAAVDPQQQQMASAMPEESPLPSDQPLDNEIDGDEPGPTPPPKDAEFHLPVQSGQAETLIPSTYVEQQQQNQSLLPEMPRTDGTLGLSLPIDEQNRHASDQSGRATPGNSSMHSRDPSTNEAHDGSVSSTIESEQSANVGQSTLQPPTSSIRDSLTPGAASSSANSLDIQHDTSQRVSITKDMSRSNSSMSQSAEQRRLNQRRHTLKELIDTEFSFNHDMKVIEDIYKGTATSVTALSPGDIRVLFGNSAQIVEFSEAFLDGLKQAARSVYVMPRKRNWSTNRLSASESNSEPQTEESSLIGTEQTDDERDRKTSVGETFLGHVARMEKVYGDYLKNHDMANQKLQKLQGVPEVRLWLNECHDYASDITSAWDLDSLLVKPVQRILKYPLLLRALLEQTPEDHPDHPHLGLAAKQSEEVSHRINESKKRAELLEQIANKNAVKRREFDPLKVFVRRTDKIAQRVGLSEAVEDAEYKRLAEKFGGRYFQLQIVMRDIEMYKKAAEEFMKQFNRYTEAIEELIDVGHSNSPEIESKWRKFAMTIREMTAIAYADHESAVKKHCIEPIVTLIRLHDGPQKLMLKRKKRIVEYAKYLTFKNRGDKIDKKTQEQGDQFIALNDTLKDELPKLFTLTAKLVEACLRNFIDIQAQWYTTWQKKIKYVLEEQNIAKTWDEIVDTFNSDFSYTEAHVLSLGICNGSLLAETSNFLSSASSFVTDDGSSAKRPSLVQQKTSPLIPQNEYERYSGGSYGISSLTSPRTSSDSHIQSVQPPTSHAQYHSRYRADSNISTHSNSARYAPNSSHPRSPAYNPNLYVPHQASRQQQRPSDSSLYHPNVAGLQQSQASYGGAYTNPQQPQTLNPNANRPLSSSTFYSATSAIPNAHNDMQLPRASPDIPSSGVFSSAMPLSDSPQNTRPTSPHTSAGQREYKVLFLAASLFEFTIDVMRREAGYPFLTYGPGEVFDVIAEKGELWLAKNQDDPKNTIGWIWEKHFAKLMSD